jgi:hypothetical protein
MSTLPIRRHIKVRSEARYHDARYAEYFKVLLPRYRRIGMQACREWNSQQLELNL